MVTVLGSQHRHVSWLGAFVFHGAKE